MKYPYSLLGFIAFTVAMIWTWNLIHEEPMIPAETHSGIQERLGQLIVDTIHQKKPEAADIQIEKVWTEAINPHRIKAFFVYTFHENSAADPAGVTTRIQGQGILDELEEDDSGQDRWKLNQVSMTHNAISFEEGLVVTGSSKGAPETSPTEKSEGDAKQ